MSTFEQDQLNAGSEFNWGKNVKGPFSIVQIRPLIASVLFFFSSFGASPAFAELVVIHAGKLISNASALPAGKSTILIENGRIRDVLPGLRPAPEGARIIDLSNFTVLPGLIDAHTHLTSEPGQPFWRQTVDTDEWKAILGVKNAETTLRAGFTTVRDVGAPPEAIFALKRGIDSGTLVGPRIIASGEGLSIVGGHGDYSGFRPEVVRLLSGSGTCTGPVECAARVREQIRGGSEIIKISATGGVLSQQSRGLDQHFTDEELKAIVETAHSLGVKVAAHAHGPRGAEAAARAGVDSIEHGSFLDASAIKAMKEHGTVLVPTLMAVTGLRERLGTGVYTEQVERKAREAVAAFGLAARAAHVAGVPIVFGTDAAVYPHGRNAEEFSLMVESIGMSPSQALAAATTSAAALLGLEEEIGEIVAGRSADLIAVSGDPLIDIRALERVEFVMTRGRVLRAE